MAGAFRNLVRVTLVAAALVGPGVGARGGPAETLTLANHYNAAGTNPDGSSYKGTVAIDILSSTTFAIKWSIGSETYEGFGMRRNDALAATYMIDGRPGLILYEVHGDGLHGLWSVRGRDGSGTEILTPAP